MSSGVSIRSDLPRSLWRSGDIDGAHAQLRRQFDKLRGSDSPPAITGDVFAVEFAQMLLHRGKFDEADRFLGGVANPAKDLETHFYVLRRVAQFCRSYSPQLAGEEARDTIFAVLPIWGDHYLDVWEHSGLKSFTASESACLFEGRRVEFLVFTTSKDRARLLAMPAMQDLVRRASVRFFNLDPILDADRRRNMDALNFAQWATLTLAKQHDAGMLLLFADTIYAKGSLAALDRAIRARSHDVLYTIDLQLDHRAWTELSGVDGSGKDLEDVAPEDLIDLFFTWPSVRERTWRLDPASGKAPARPFRLSRVEDGAAELRSFLPQPFYISADLTRDFFAQLPMGLDFVTVEFAWAALGGAARMRVLNDPGEFLCATIDTPKAESGGDDPWSASLSSSDVVAGTLGDLARRSLLGHARQWAFSEALRLGKPVTDTCLAEIGDRAGQYRTRRCEAHTEYLLFVREVVLPAFDGRGPAVVPNRLEATLSIRSEALETGPRRLPYPSALNDDAGWKACLNESWHERDVDHAEKIAKILMIKTPQSAEFIIALLHIRGYKGEIDLWPSPRLAVMLAPRDGRAVLYKRWFTALRLFDEGDVDGAIPLMRTIGGALRTETPFAFGLNLRTSEETLALLRGGEPPSGTFWHPVEPISGDGRRFTILLAGNQDYMDRFCVDFLRSAAEKSPRASIHLHYCDPAITPRRQLDDAREAFPELRISASWSVRRDLPRPTYFACARFLVAPHLLRLTEAPILIADLDATLRRDPAEFMEVLEGADLGLAVSENGKHWNTVKAGLLWAAPTRSGMRFMSGLAHYLEAVLTSKDCIWTLDQTALWAARRHMAETCPDTVVLNLYDVRMPDGRDLDLVEEMTVQISASRVRAIARARAKSGAN